MNEYCQLLDYGLVVKGDFHESRIVPSSGQPFHIDENFLDALALRVMQQYESQPFDEPLEIEDNLLEKPNRTKLFYRRLFNASGKCTQSFITEASEALAQWIEESLEQVLFSFSGIPHNSDPAFDVLSIIEEETGPYLRIIQVKATKAQLQYNSGIALTKFEQLEKGYYDAELSATLDIMRRSFSEELNVRALKLYRRYRVTIMYSEDRDIIEIMTKYNQKVKGPSVRRSSLLMNISWDEFWSKLSEKVYAQLS